MDTEILTIVVSFLGVLVSGASALIGAGIGGAATFIVGRAAVRAQQLRDKAAAEDEVRAVLQAISEELRALHEMHTSPTGGARVIEAAQPGEPIEFHYPIFDRYFTVYESCASQIGKIPDSELRRQIVAVYAYLRAMIDTVRLNNDFMRQTEIAMLNYERLKDDPALGPKFAREYEIHRAQMTEYAPVLKAAHSRAMDAYQDLRFRLECFAGCRGIAPT
ncbi:TPA: hypothetical protein QEL76_000642 [Stenotrophomonas maltophilia]|nr:hypothetical protein [Stenotrophomonas maltophilia]